MEGYFLAGMAGLVLLWSAVSARAGRANITAPIAFLAAGLIFGLTDVLPLTSESFDLRLIAELTLVVVLFHDASTVRLAALRRDWQIPLRLLAIAFPLAVALTMATSYFVAPALGVAGALLIAGAVTPTDAGLGAPTVLNPRVPVRVRRALNVESGLNDGLATPIVLAALAVLGAAEENGDGLVVTGGAIPIGIIIGAVLGAGSAKVLDRSRMLASSSMRGRSLGVVAVPFLTFGLADVIGGNAFIAAFVAGLAFSRTAEMIAEEPDVNLAAEDVADLMGYIVWFLAGAFIGSGAIDLLDWRPWLVAVLALTVLRVLPVWVSLWGMHLRWQTVLFLGWFGPRGLATLVFALLALESIGLEDPVVSAAVDIMGLVVILSVVLHGATAGPLSERYGAWVERIHPPIEMEPSTEPMPSRGRHAQFSSLVRRH